MRRFWGWLGTTTPWRFRVAVMATAVAVFGAGVLLDQRALFSTLGMSVIVGANVLWIVRDARRQKTLEQRH